MYLLNEFFFLTSVGRSALFDIALVRAALLGVGCRGSSSSHKLIRLLDWLASVLGFLFLQGA